MGCDRLLHPISYMYPIYEVRSGTASQVGSLRHGIWGVERWCRCMHMVGHAGACRAMEGRAGCRAMEGRAGCRAMEGRDAHRGALAIACHLRHTEGHDQGMTRA